MSSLSSSSERDPEAGGLRERLAATVALVTDEPGFAALAPAWNALAAQRPDLSVFGQHEWFDAAWQWRRDAGRLFVLAWRDRGQVRAILPMLVRDARGRLGSHRELSLLTVPDTQVCDMLVAAVDATGAADAFAGYLAAHHGAWDVMRLGYLAPDSAIATKLAPAMAAAGFRTFGTATPGNPLVSLEGGWAAYYAGRSRRLKKACNLAANRLARAGDVRVEWLEPGERDAQRLADIVGKVAEISKSSWKRETGTTLDQPGPGAFIRRLSSLAMDRGWLSIWMLTLNGTALAMEYQLVHDGNVHALRSDFRTGYEEISPGSHLSRTMLERLFERGLACYYMGPGNNAYKYRWAEDARPQVATTVYSRSMAGRLLHRWERRWKPRLAALRTRFAQPVPPTAGSTDD